MRHTRLLSIVLFRGFSAGALICLLGALSGRPAQADGLPADRVDELRQSLQENRFAGNLDARKKDLDRRVGALAPLLVLATKDREPQVREAAARALGRINADTEEAFTALGQMLRTGDVGARRAAAEAMVNIMRQISPAELKNRTAATPLELADRVIKAGKLLLPIAGRGIADRDVEVRRPCVGAIQQTALP